MKKKQLIIIPLILFCWVLGKAQTVKERCYFTTKKDTVFCTQLSYGTTGQGYLNRLEYVDSQGKKVLLKGEKNVPDVITLLIDGVIIDKTPIHADKPEGYVRFTPRIVNGLLIINQSDVSPLAPKGAYIFSLKIPDGTYYELNSKNMKKFIKPYLIKCKKFETEFKGNYNDDRDKSFIDMIKLYNSLCK